MSQRISAVAADAARFVGIGAVNTVLTTLLYQALLFQVDHTSAFAIAWLSGLVLVSVAYPKIVFRSGPARPYRILANACYYALSFFVSLWVLRRLSLEISPRIAVFAMLGIVTPLNFVVSRQIFRLGQPPSDERTGAPNCLHEATGS